MELSEIVRGKLAEAARTERERIRLAVENMDYPNGNTEERRLEDILAILNPESATEPRTCETCETPYCDQYKRGGSCPNYSPRPVLADIAAADRVLAWIKAELGWSLGDPETGELGPEGIETRNRLASVIGTRPVSAEDVETVRSFINYVTESFSHFPTIARRKTAAIAALDRIAGKDE